MSEFDKNKMLEKALDDLQALIGMRDSKIFSDEIFGFHAQQAVEKSLKAWINHLGREHPKIHDIRELLRLLQEYGADVGKFLNLVELNIFAVQFRYDTKYESETPIDRDLVIDNVRKIVDHVDKIVNTD